ncbi:unnamed protein product [Boreogadus saida]
MTAESVDAMELMPHFHCRVRNGSDRKGVWSRFGYRNGAVPRMGPDRRLRSASGGAVAGSSRREVHQEDLHRVGQPTQALVLNWAAQMDSWGRKGKG